MQLNNGKPKSETANCTQTVNTRQYFKPTICYYTAYFSPKVSKIKLCMWTCNIHIHTYLGDKYFSPKIFSWIYFSVIFSCNTIWFVTWCYLTVSHFKPDDGPKLSTTQLAVRHTSAGVFIGVCTVEALFLRFFLSGHGAPISKYCCLSTAWTANFYANKWYTSVRPIFLLTRPIR